MRFAFWVQISCHASMYLVMKAKIERIYDVAKGKYVF